MFYSKCVPCTVVDVQDPGVSKADTDPATVNLNTCLGVGRVTAVVPYRPQPGLGKPLREGATAAGI